MTMASALIGRWRTLVYAKDIREHIRQNGLKDWEGTYSFQSRQYMAANGATDPDQYGGVYAYEADGTCIYSHPRLAAHPYLQYRWWIADGRLYLKGGPKNNTNSNPIEFVDDDHLILFDPGRTKKGSLFERIKD